MKIKIMHFIYQLSIGGLENGLVNLVNELNTDCYHHYIISIKKHDDYAKKIKVNNVTLIDLNLSSGQLLKHYLKLYLLIKKIKPKIVHTRNLATIEVQFLSFLNLIPKRIHGEHGRNELDLNGTNLKNRLIRIFLKPFINQYISLSDDITCYLKEKVFIDEKKNN